MASRAGGPARPGPPAMPHPVRALTLTFLGCPAAAPPRASSSRQRAWGRSRRSWSSNHRGVGDSHHPGLLASRLSALWVEGPTRRSTDLSFRASPAWRAHFLYHWRVEPGTRTAPILGHRVVRVRWYPARSLKPAAGIVAVTSCLGQVEQTQLPCVRSPMARSRPVRVGVCSMLTPALPADRP